MDCRIAFLEGFHNGIMKPDDVSTTTGLPNNPFKHREDFLEAYEHGFELALLKLTQLNHDVLAKVESSIRDC